MAHAVSLTYTRFDHMSPAALAMTTLLHIAVGAALWWISPLNHIDSGSEAVEITMEREPAPAETPQPPQPSPTPEPQPQAAPAPAPTPATPPTPPAPPTRLGLAPIGPSTDPKATPGTQQPSPPKPDNAAEAARPEPPKPDNKAEPAQSEPPKPEQQQALATPPPPPAPPSLEKALPQLEAPPPPVTSREVPRPAPPPPAPKAPPPQQPAQRPPPQPAPRPPQQGLQSSPLSHLPPPRTPAEQQAARQAPTFTNPADMLGQKRAEEQYLWYVAQKISQHQQFVRNVTTETGTVVVRLTIARDGRLVDVSLVRSSGLPSLDTASINVIRSAGPYPLLPEDIAGPQHTFVLPLTYRRSE